MSQDIEDPIELVRHCNKHIQKLEMYIALAETAFKETNDSEHLMTIAKMEGHLVKWTEELEHALHQKYQQGLAQTDVTQGVKKVRVHGGKAS